MQGFATSTIAALCYANKTEFDFRAMASELGRTLWDNPRGPLNMHSQYDDFIIYDLPGLRICLAYTDLESENPDMALAAGCAQIVMISVGSAPDWIVDDLTGVGAPDDRIALREQLALYVERHARYSHQIVLERPDVVTEDLYDEIVEQVWLATLRRDARHLAAEQDAATARAAEAAADDAEVLDEIPGARRVSRFGPVPGEGDLAGLDARAEAEWAAREAAFEARAAEYDAPQPARAGPGAAVRPVRPTHPAMHADRRGQRPTMLPLRPPEPAIYLRPSVIFDADPETQPLVHRAAVNALNASMVAFALPVGAALLTLSVLGRESLGLSSRTTAITGAFMGITQGDTVLHLLRLIS